MDAVGASALPGPLLAFIWLGWKKKKGKNVDDCDYDVDVDVYYDDDGTGGG